MYSLRNLFQQEPIAIVGVFMLGLNLLVVLHPFGLVLTTLQLAAVNAFLLPFLNLFYVRPRTASKAAMKELAANGKKRAG